MSTVPKLQRGARSLTPHLQIEQQTAGVRDLVRNALQECNALPSIDETVVVSERQVHHGTGNDLTLFIHNRAHLGGVHAEDGRLGRVDDGGTKQGSKYPSVAGNDTL